VSERKQNENNKEGIENPKHRSCIMTRTYRQTHLDEFEGFSEIVKAEAENQERVRELYGRFHANRGRDSKD
jgi:hypothetical protein